ncbi:hypothetical protein E4S40_10805 [Algoriphagus kandeliae]|uniref:Uncharacterized protein n=1 Tax=Algoriphagus kandeliae TaxID=2562278 RepID=A0A4Y9QS86_9BACT|nr:hypothetical protein [Algoriphagus kandeliae]TFV94502.1 hypothetical protein E4S40_10805 [Algoriphagus kandeliae]
MKTVQYPQKLNLYFRNGEIRKVQVQEYITLDSIVRVADFLNEQDQIILFSFIHSRLNVQLDLNGVSSHIVLQFDGKMEFEGASLSLGKSEGSFGIQVQARHVLILPFDRDFKIEAVTSFEIDQSEKSSGEIFVEGLRRLPFTHPSERKEKGFIIHRKK